MKLIVCTLSGIGVLLLGVVATLVVHAEDTAAAKKENRRIEHARVFLALTRLDLQMALARNKANPNTFPGSMIVLLEQQAAVAEEWLRHTQNSDSTAYDFTVNRAQIIANAEAANYANAVKLNRLGAMNAEDLERIRLKSELAQLSLGWAKEIDPSSTTALMQFHVVRLGENVGELTRTQLELLDRN